MLDSATLSEYINLKNKMDAAYTVFKKEPSVINATRHTTAAQAFTSFCVDTMATLTGVTDEAPDKQAEILANFDQYKECACCGEQLLYRVDDKHFIQNVTFVPEFKGWCHTCLVAHCCNIDDCSACPLPAELGFDYAECPYKEVRKLYRNN